MSEIVGENIFVVENLCSRSENTQAMIWFNESHMSYTPVSAI